MRIIGLTGGIGTGKSTASDYLRKQGFAIIDADSVSREIVEPGTPLLEELTRHFGDNIRREDGSLDRKGLGAIVFADPKKRELLDRLTHGPILREIEARARALKKRGGRGIIVDAPLLFETGLEEKCDQVWLITAEEALRIARVCARDGLTPEEVSARIGSQMEEGEKKKRADRVIDNSSSREALLRQLAGLLAEEGL